MGNTPNIMYSITMFKSSYTDFSGATMKSQKNRQNRRCSRIPKHRNSATNFCWRPLKYQNFWPLLSVICRERKTLQIHESRVPDPWEKFLTRTRDDIFHTKAAKNVSLRDKLYQRIYVPSFILIVCLQVLIYLNSLPCRRIRGVGGCSIYCQ